MGHILRMFPLGLFLELKPFLRLSSAVDYICHLSIKVNIRIV